MLILKIIFDKLQGGISYVVDGFVINYVVLSMTVAYNVLTACIILLILILSTKDFINSKIKINIEPKKIFMIISVVFIIIMLIKIIISFSQIFDSNKKINILEDAVNFQDLNKFLKLDFDPKITTEKINEILEGSDMTSYNNILYKVEATSSEAFYKMETTGLEKLLNNKYMTRKKVLSFYTNAANKYIARIDLYKRDLGIQIFMNIFMYAINILCVYIVYKKTEDEL